MMATDITKTEKPAEDNIGFATHTVEHDAVEELQLVLSMALK